MGFAPYGNPRYVRLIKEHLVDIRDDGSLRMNQEYFAYLQGLRVMGTAFEQLLGGPPPRQPKSPITKREMDLARSIQDVTEEVMLKIVRYAYRETGQRYLCLAGGVALNCVANDRILRQSPFEEVWVQPAAGDAGGSLCVALLSGTAILPSRVFHRSARSAGCRRARGLVATTHRTPTA